MDSSEGEVIARADGETRRDIEPCPACAELMDVSDFSPHSEVECAHCAKKVWVKRQIGKYTIEQLQGQGGMSLVYAAHDATLERKVAIKLLNSHYAEDAKRIAEFEKEAKITASISHPNVVRVYTVGQAYGHYYIAMELVDGVSLEQMINEQGKLEAAVLVRLAIEVVEGLMAAHAVGLLHRDMKPGNILLTRKGHAKIVDFGLALMTSGGKVRAEEIWATPYYTAPESLRMEEEDQRSDIYALGMSLYHAALGAAPFTTESRSTSELIQIKMTLKPLREVGPEVDRYLAMVIDKAAAAEVEQRYQNYPDFLAALKALEDYLRSGVEPNEDVLMARSASVQGRVRQQRLLLGGLAVVGVLLASGVGWMLWKPSEVEKVDVAAPFVALQSDAEIAKIEQQRELRKSMAQLLHKAQESFEAGDYAAAQQSYAAVVQQTEVERETVLWSGLRAAICAWVLGDSALASEMLQATQVPNAAADVSEDDVARSVSAVEQQLHDAVCSLLDENASVGEAASPMLELAFALRSWNAGDFAGAQSWFLKVQQHPLTAEIQDLPILQKITSAYLSDFKLLESARSELGATTVELAEAALVRVKAQRGSLQTQGKSEAELQQIVQRAEEHVAMLQQQLIEKQNRQAQEREQRALAKEQRWKKARAASEDALQKHDFVSVQQKLLEAQPLEDGEQQWREGVLYFVNNTVELYAVTYQQLDGKSANFSVSNTDGNTFTRIAGASREGLMVQGKGQSRLLSWAEIDPHSMLTLQKKLASKLVEDAEKSQRREQLAAYCWLVGLHEIAQSGAAVLAKKDEEFAKRWEECTQLVQTAELDEGW